MKTLPLFLIAGLAITAACSSPEEKNQQRRQEARQSYEKDLKQSQEQYEEDVMAGKRKEAKKMIDKSDSVQVDQGSGNIKVDE